MKADDSNGLAYAPGAGIANRWQTRVIRESRKTRDFMLTRRNGAADHPNLCPSDSRYPVLSIICASSQPNKSGYMKKETSSSAVILCILSIHVKRSFSSVFLCALRGESFSLFSAPQRLWASIVFFSVSIRSPWHLRLMQFGNQRDAQQAL